MVSRLLNAHAQSKTNVVGCKQVWNLHGICKMKVSRGMATIGLRQYALSWTMVLGRVGACTFAMTFVGFPRLI